MHLSKQGRWFVGFGLFLIICGLLGYLSNPEKAKTALISGGSFGLLSALWGFWMLKGGGKAPWIAAGVTTLLLVAAFTWRALASWQALLAGEPKWVPALLITAMWIGAVASLAVLWQARRS